MQKVEYVGPSIDQKLNHTWNFSNIRVAYRASIFQLKERVETQEYRHKNDLQKCRKMKIMI